jgi:hypothetical protein
MEVINIVKKDDLNTLKTMLESNPELINQKINKAESNILHFAVMVKSNQIAEYLVGERLGTTFLDESGWGFLHKAAMVNNYKLISNIIKSEDTDLEDIDFNCIDLEGNTPLMTATMAGHKETIELLIDVTDLSIKNFANYTAKQLASKNLRHFFNVISFDKEPEKLKNAEELLDPVSFEDIMEGTIYGFSGEPGKEYCLGTKVTIDGMIKGNFKGKKDGEFFNVILNKFADIDTITYCKRGE